MAAITPITISQPTAPRTQAMTTTGLSRRSLVRWEALNAATPRIAPSTAPTAIPIGLSLTRAAKNIPANTPTNTGKYPDDQVVSHEAVPGVGK